MLHPIIVIAFGIVFSCMGTSGFLSSGGRVSGLHGAGEEILKFEGFYEICVPDHTAIFDADISEAFVDLSNPPNTLL